MSRCSWKRREGVRVKIHNLQAGPPLATAAREAAAGDALAKVARPLLNCANPIRCFSRPAKSF